MAKDVELLARLRGVIGFLGQKSQAGWWDTTFLGSTGLEVLNYNFPRDPCRAGVTSTCQAARHVHDHRIGTTGVYHLFRLPAALEQPVHQASPFSGPAENRVPITDPDQALAWLKEQANGAVKVSEGPVQVGCIQDIHKRQHIRELASQYFSALEQGVRCFPYFASRS